MYFFVFVTYLCRSNFILGVELDPAVCLDVDNDGLCDAMDTCTGTDTDGDGKCDVEDLCPYTSLVDLDLDGYCPCNDSTPLDDDTCDCNEEQIGRNCTFDFEGRGDGPTTTTTTGDPGVELWNWLGPTLGSAATVFAIGIVIHFRQKAVVAGHLKIYQKEIFNEAMNRNRSATVQLLDMGDADPINPPSADDGGVASF